MCKGCCTVLSRQLRTYENRDEHKYTYRKEYANAANQIVLQKTHKKNWNKGDATRWLLLVHRD